MLRYRKKKPISIVFHKQKQLASIVTHIAIYPNTSTQIQTTVNISLCCEFTLFRYLSFFPSFFFFVFINRKIPGMILTPNRKKCNANNEKNILILCQQIYVVSPASPTAPLPEQKNEMGRNRNPNII